MITYIDRRNINCVKWDSFGADVLPMWIADMDFKAPDCVIEAIKKFNDFGVYGYCDIREEYYDAIINWEKKRHNLEIKKEWIISSADVLQAIGWIVGEFTDEKDAIMLSSPVYNPFFEIIKSNNRTLVDNKLVFSNIKYEYDFEDFEAKIIKHNVKMYILCNPHNPLGRVWKKEEIQKIVDICKKHNVYIISDEIHQDFAYKENKHTSILHFAKEYQNIFAITSTSKSFSLASLKNAFSFIPNEENAKRYSDAQAKLRTKMGNTLGYITTEAVYNLGEEWLEAVKELIYNNYIYIKNAFDDYREYVFVSELEGTFLLWMKLEKFIDKAEVSNFLRKKCKIEVNQGEWFGGDDYKGFFRVNLATSRENVEEFVRRLKTNIDIILSTKDN